MDTIILEFLQNDQKFPQYKALLMKEAERKNNEKHDEMLLYNQKMEEKFSFLKKVDQKLIYMRSTEPQSLKGASILRESLLDYNSFAKSEASTKITNFKSFVSLKKFKEAEKINNAKIKDLRLVSKIYRPEIQPEHRPRVMTTNKCYFFFSKI